MLDKTASSALSMLRVHVNTSNQMSFKDANNRIHLDRVWPTVLTILYAKLTFCSFKRTHQKFFTICRCDTRVELKVTTKANSTFNNSGSQESRVSERTFEQ